MKTDNPDYIALRQQVETVFGGTVSCPKEFKALSESIFTRCGSMISVSTLKRFWGYVTTDDRNKMSRNTLNLLSNYVGYTDWNTFCQRQLTDAEIDSSDPFYGHEYLLASKLQIGNELRLMWAPDRNVIVRFAGNDVFMVVESVNSKLQVGDTFKCPTFVEGLPLILVDLFHDNRPACSYICGKQGGIKYSVLSHI